jgi:protein-S-isoprenylcysteine O-methyltransferase Ste14
MPAIATGICWGIVLVVWIAGAIYGARKAPGRRQGSASNDALWRLGAAVVAVALYHAARSELDHVADHSLWIRLPGLVLLVASTVFTLWARFSLGRMWSATPNMLRADHQLRTDGPYAVTRHPIYTGLYGMLIGTVLLNGLGVSLVFLVIGTVVVATRVPVEERLMTKTFPEEYPRYRTRVPQLVPGLNLLRRSGGAVG